MYLKNVQMYICILKCYFITDVSTDLFFKFAKLAINYSSHNYKLRGHIAIPATQLQTYKLNNCEITVKKSHDIQSNYKLNNR